MKYSELLII